MTKERIEIDRIIGEVADQSGLLDQAIGDLNTAVDEQSAMLEQAVNNLNAEVDDQSELLDQALDDLNTAVAEQESMLEQAVNDLNAEVSDQAGMLDQALNDLNAEISDQSALLDQAIVALEGKAVGGGADPVVESLEITENGTYTAPEGVDGYSPVIVNVPIPAGLPDGVSKIASGVYQSTSDRTTAVDVAHNLGVKPDFCWWVLESDVSSAPMANTTVAGCYTEKAAIYSNSLKTPYHSHYFMLAYNTSSALQRTAQSVEAAAFTTTTCRLMANAQYRLKAGCTYRWVCGVLG